MILQRYFIRSSVFTEPTQSVSDYYVFGEFSPGLSFKSTFQTVEGVFPVLNVEVFIQISSVLATEVTKFAVESGNVMLGLQVFLVLVVRRTDDWAASLLTIEGGLLFLGSTGLVATEFLCLVV